MRGSELHHRDVRGGTDTHGRPPGARASRHVQLGVAVAFEPGDRGIGELGQQVPGPELASVGVAGELETDAVLHCVVDDDGLVREQDGGTTAVAVAERAGEVGPLPSLSPATSLTPARSKPAISTRAFSSGCRPSSRTWSTHWAAPEKYSWLPVTK